MKQAPYIIEVEITQQDREQAGRYYDCVHCTIGKALQRIGFSPEDIVVGPIELCIRVEDELPDRNYVRYRPDIEIGFEAFGDIVPDQWVIGKKIIFTRIDEHVS